MTAHSPQTSSESWFPGCPLSSATLDMIGSIDIKIFGRRENQNSDTKGPHCNKSFVLESIYFLYKNDIFITNQKRTTRHSEGLEDDISCHVLCTSDPFYSSWIYLS